MKWINSTCIAIWVSGLSAVANAGSWTNQAGHVLVADVEAIKGGQVMFKSGTQTVTYPITAFRPTEQKRLKEAVGLVEVPDGLKEAHALVQRTLKRLHVLLEGGEITAATCADQCEAARKSFRLKAAPYIDQGMLTEQQVLQLSL